MECQERLQTFEKWNNKVVNKFTLAKVGFRYTGIGDKVQCDYCSGIIVNWQAGDDAYREHKKRFPNCSLVHRLEEDDKTDFEPQYRDLKTRRETFLQHIHRHTPNELATTGFYYTGSADRVRCFHCGVVLRDWNIDDDPDELHRILSPFCGFTRNNTNFQRLGIQLRDKQEANDAIQLQQHAEESLVSDPEKQKLVDDISPNSPLFQQLCGQYDKDTITREMIVMIQRNGRNFKNSEEFATLVSDRLERLSESRKCLKHLNQLKEENERLRAEKLCRICEEKKTAVLFLPCGHLLTCVGCADTVKDCLKCREPIKGTMPVYGP